MRNKDLIVSCFVGLLACGAFAVYAPPAQAQLFGESDEEKAARQKHEDGQDAQIAQLAQRIAALEESERSLEESLRQATGNNEALTHRIDELSAKLERQQKDFSYRLCMLSAQQLGVGQDNNGLNCASAAAPPASTLPSLQNGTAYDDNTPSQNMTLAPKPGVLGTLPAEGPAGPSEDRGQFDAAMNLLAKAQYDEARAAFRAYADSHPGIELSGQAIYWVGDIFYVQKDYPSAARTFAEGIKKYPNGNRGPDSMLKLGQSLLAEGQTQGGCTALAALKSKYPHASDSTLAAAAGARKAACH